MTRNGHYEHATICGNDIGVRVKNAATGDRIKWDARARRDVIGARKQTEVTNAYDNPDSGTR